MNRVPRYPRFTFGATAKRNVPERCTVNTLWTAWLAIGMVAFVIVNALFTYIVK